MFTIFARYFAPWNGIDEDPVNGSSHTVLAPHFHRDRPLVATMESRRGGTLRLDVQGDRVHIGGSAVVVTRGNFGEIPVFC